MFTNKRRWMWPISILLALGVGFYVGNLKVSTVQLKQVELQNQVADLQNQVQTLQQKNSQATKDGVQAIDSVYVEAIKQRGVEDPQLLFEDLKKHSDLIPSEGELGGVMFFTDMKILNERWIYGAYEDGHTAGYGIFQWNKEGDVLKWTLVFQEGQ